MTTLYTLRACARVKQPDGTYGPAVWALIGGSPGDCEAIAKLPSVALKTAVTAPRDQGRHRYLMRLFNVAWKAIPEDWPAMSYDTFRHALMVDAGFFDTAYVPDDGNSFEVVATYPPAETVRIPWSLEFAAMDDTRHKEVVDGIIKCLVSKWIPGLDSEAFTNEVRDAIG